MTTCEWAMCTRPAKYFADGYWHCTRHYHAHRLEFPLPVWEHQRATEAESLERAFEVLTEMGLTAEQLAVRDQRPRTVALRQQAMYRLRTETYLTLAQIGELFGRDHSTVHHALRKHRAAA